MLPQRSRIRLGPEIRNVVKRGRRFTTDTSIAYLRLREASTGCRFGYICGKSVGNAVIRNHTLRRFRSICADYLDDDGVARLDIVIRIQKSAAEEDFQKLRHDVIRIMRFGAKVSQKEPTGG